MTAIFADTFYWIAFTNVQDRAHSAVPDRCVEESARRGMLLEGDGAGLKGSRLGPAIATGK